MRAFFCRGLVVGDVEVVALGGVVFRTGEFIPLGCGKVLANAYIYDARLDGTADGILAVDWVVGGIHAVALYQKVGTALVFHGMVELHRDVTAVCAEVNQVAILGQHFLASFQHLRPGHALLHFGKNVHKLSGRRTILQDFYLLRLCDGIACQ